jgi:RimJ/RimL family protein N-acetyltransferase
MKLLRTDGSRIALRSFRRGDIPYIHKYLDDRRVSRYLPSIPHPYTEADARAWVNTAQRLARLDTGYHFAIEHGQDSHLIGSIGLKTVNLTHRNAEVGYWLARPYWRTGCSIEALRMILRFVFTELKLHRVYAVVLSSNVASVALLEKVGSVRESVMRESLRISRRWQDVYAYGILDREFTP